MELDECRQQMESFRQDVDKEARSLKDPYVAVERLHDLYRRFDTQERAMADQVLSEWLLSEDDGLRFDAQAIIAEFKIKRALPALHELANRFASSTDIRDASYKREVVNRVIAALADA